VGLVDQGGQVERTDVNPWEWSKAFGFSQAVDLSEASRLLLRSGQRRSPDRAEQVEKALNNLTRVLTAAGMTMADLVKLTAYTTDVDELNTSYPQRSSSSGTTFFDLVKAEGTPRPSPRWPIHRFRL
jgi:enamine deaminase RidA (YjgF/YER057c/UK114 family)